MNTIGTCPYSEFDTLNNNIAQLEREELQQVDRFIKSRQQLMKQTQQNVSNNPYKLSLKEESNKDRKTNTIYHKHMSTPLHKNSDALLTKTTTKGTTNKASTAFPSHRKRSSSRCKRCVIL